MKYACNPAKGWPRTFIEWAEENTIHLSVVFSWDLPKAHARAIWLKEQGYRVKAGGPAIMMNPEYMASIAEVNEEGFSVLRKHNKDATFTSRGCIRKCAFCAVPKIEGGLVELDNWAIKPIVCDNNFLACSKAHFGRVIDSLKPLSGIDFNQGLDARLLTKYHAERLSELDLSWVRLAFDHSKSEKEFRRAVKLLTDAGFPNGKIAVYILLGFRHTPEDALYRMHIVAHELGCRPYPMRYQPLDTLVRSSYISPEWTRDAMWKMVTYWSRRELWHIPFGEFAMHRNHYRKYPADDRQLELL